MLPPHMLPPRTSPATPSLRVTPRGTAEHLSVHPTAFIARGAVVVGEVHLGPEASVWFGCVLRGDTDAIRVGAGSNVQDLTVIHADLGEPSILGEGVTVGHRCVIHGCTIGDGSLIGMGAIVLNRARIGDHCLVGAGALVTQGKVFEPRTLILGAPARAVRALTDEELANMAQSAQHYVDAGRRWHEAGWHQWPPG